MPQLKKIHVVRLLELKVGIVRTIVANKGKEFHVWIKVEKRLELSFYFSDSGAPKQRGTNEYTTGRIRRTYPKGTDFSRFTQ